MQPTDITKTNTAKFQLDVDTVDKEPPSPVLAPLSVTQRSALAERGSRDNCLRMLVILASFLANRYCACTTR